MLTLLAIAAIVLIGSFALFIFLGWRLDVHDRTAFEATLTPVEAARLRGFRSRGKGGTTGGKPALFHDCSGQPPVRTVHAAFQRNRHARDR